METIEFEWMLHSHLCGASAQIELDYLVELLKIDDPFEQLFANLLLILKVN